MTRKVHATRRFDLILHGSTEDKLKGVFDLVIARDRHHSLKISKTSYSVVGNRSHLRVIGTYAVKGAWPSDVTRRFQRACTKLKCGARMDLVDWA